MNRHMSLGRRYTGGEIVYIWIACIRTHPMKPIDGSIPMPVSDGISKFDSGTDARKAGWVSVVGGWLCPECSRQLRNESREREIADAL